MLSQQLQAALLFDLDSSLTLGGETGNIDVTVNGVNVPNNGTFTSTVEFIDDGTNGVIGSASADYTIDAPELSSFAQTSASPDPVDPGQQVTINAEGLDQLGNGIDGESVSFSTDGQGTLTGVTNATSADGSPTLEATYDAVEADAGSTVTVTISADNTDAETTVTFDVTA